MLQHAILFGECDDLESPSARLVTGQLVRGGTGAFDVMQDLTVQREAFTYVATA